MATLAVLEQRKHELRTELVRSVQGNGREHPDTWKIYRKLNEVKRAETYLRRSAVSEKQSTSPVYVHSSAYLDL